MFNHLQRLIHASVRPLLFAAAAMVLAFVGCGPQNQGPSVPSKRADLTDGDGGRAGGTARTDRGGGGPQRALQLDDASEDELGQAVVLRITNRYPVVTDTRLAEYVNLVGLTAAGGSEQPDRNFTFGVL